MDYRGRKLMKEYKLVEMFEKMLREKLNELVFDNEKAYVKGVISDYYAGIRDGMQESFRVMMSALLSVKEDGL